MSGILGIWNLDGRPLEAGLLARLNGTLKHRGPDGAGYWADSSVGLASQQFRITPESQAEVQPLVHAGGCVIVFDGRLDNREDLLSRLPASSGVSGTTPDCALVMEAYRAFGTDFVRLLAGEFAFGLFDPARRQLVVARDPIGLRPVYYCRTGNTFLFASEIKALLAHPGVKARPNDDILAEFIFCRLLFPDESGATFFQDVFSLPPAYMAVITPDRFERTRYWDFDLTARVRFRTVAEYADAYRHHFTEAVRRRLRSVAPVGVSLSGGLDSSSVFCVAETLARENPGLPRVIGSARTFPTGSPADEAAFLLDIERQYGILLDRLPITPTEFVDDSRQWAWRTETPVLVSDATGLHTLSHFVDHLGARVVLTGHWGDQFLCDQMYLMDMLRRGSFLQVRGHLKQYREYFTPEGFKFLKRCFLNNVARFCTPHALAPLLRRFRARWFPNPQAPRYYASAFAERAKDVARQPTFIQNTLERPHATYHAASLYTTVRSRHHIMWMEWADKAGAYVRLQFLYPFLDRDLIAFQMAIPGDIQTRGGVPKAILRQAMKGIVPEAVLERRWKADFGMATNAGIEQEYNKLFDCLSPSSMVAKMGYAEQEQLTRQLESARSRIAGSTGELAGVLMDLLGLELFLEAFCGEPRSCHFAHSK